MKDTEGKIRPTLLPASALAELVKVLEFGARKYRENSWKREPVGKYRDAFLRHWYAYQEGRRFDEESGLPVVAHMAVNLIFVLWKEMKNGRYKKQQ